MHLEISTPALLFPAISLLFISYTNRFTSTGQLIRGLGLTLKESQSKKIKDQLKNLKKRMELIRLMQIVGCLSLLFCTISMFSLFFNLEITANIFFILSLLSMVYSLILCFSELYISTIALKIELRGLLDA